MLSLDADVELLNSGTGIAYDLLAAIAHVTITAPATLDIMTLPRPTWEVGRVRGLLAPGATVPVRLPPLRPDSMTFDSFQRGAVRLYVAGVIMYRDEFGDWTEYRFSSRFAQVQNFWIFDDDRILRKVNPGDWIPKYDGVT